MDGGSDRKLPPGWAWATLGEITLPAAPKLAADPKSDLPFLGMDGMEPHALRPSHFGRFGDMRSAASGFGPGDVLYGRLRPYLNKVWRADVAGAASAEFIVFPANEFIDSDFLMCCLHHVRFVNFALSLTAGDRPRVDRDAIAGYPIALPPKNEQRRIAARINELFGEIEAGAQELEQAREGLETYRRAVLKAAVTGELTKDWRARNAPSETGADLLRRMLGDCRACVVNEHENAGRKFAVERQSSRRKWTEAHDAGSRYLHSLPADWVWARVDQVGEVKLGRQRAPQHHHGDHMRPYLRVANVFEDRLDLSDVKEMNFTPKEFETYELRYGDILLNEGQTPTLVGRPAMYRGEISGCCYQKTLLRFRSHAEINRGFALIVFRAYLHTGRFRRSASITTNIAHLPAEKFVQIEFPVPSRAEQDAIVEAARDHLSLIDEVGGEIALRTRGARELRQAILATAFSGRLVPQDPADEPAAVLLERLRAAKTAAAPARRSAAAPAKRGRPKLRGASR